MRFVQLAFLIFASFTSSALAGHNCKCQDANGQYDDSTKLCCKEQKASINQFIHYPGPNHQCVSDFNSLDDGAFVICCQGTGTGGAFCW